MSKGSHIKELRKKHESLSLQVEEAQRHPSADALELASMKKQKLKLKEEISRLSDA